MSEFIDIDHDDEETFEYAERPNKSQLKRDIARVLSVAEEICALTEAQINTLQLPENTRKAALEALKMPHRGARKRQLKYITAQLRRLDLASLQERLDRLKSQSVHTVREHHQAERWRDQLLSETEGHQQLTQFMREFPQADSQHLKQLQRNACKEKQHEKPPRSARLLYQYLKGLIAAQNHD